MSALVRRGAPLLAAVLAFAGVGIAAAIEREPSTCITSTGRTVPRAKNDPSKSPFCAPAKTRSRPR